MNDSLILARVDKAQALLLQAKSAIECKKVADMAAAAKIFATKQHSQKAKEYAHAIWIDALRLEGDYLERQPKHPPGPEKRIGNSREPIPLTLKDQGIPKKESATAQMLARAAREVPDLVAKCREMKGKINDIKRHYKKQEHAKKVKHASNKAGFVSDSPVDLILADPPWRYEHCEANNREIENQYETATLKDIFSHIEDVSVNKDCILFLWATAPKLEEALQVMKSWGFNYRSCAVWDKQKIGMGYWWRIQHELLLVGIKGKPECTPECERISSIFSEPRTKHSAKPECVYQWIERAFPQSNKLEMYCRKPRPGWAIHGNEC